MLYRFITNYLVRIPLGALFVCECLFSAGATTAEELVFVADLWCPYNCEASGADQGLIVDTARAAFERQGHKITYKIIPWARAIEETRAGKHDAIVGSSKLDAPDFVFPDQAQAISHYVFFVSPDNKWRYTGMESVSKVSVGVIRDYAYGEPFDSYAAEHADNPKLIQVSSGDDALNTNVKKLLSGRLHAVIENSFVMKSYLQNNQLTGRLVEAGELGHDEVFVAFSPKKSNSKKWAKLLSEAMQEFKSDGTYDRLMAKYNLSNGDHLQLAGQHGK